MIIEIATFATEPELKTIQFGTAKRSVMNGRIAIRQGKDHASFINVTAWGKLAEYIGNNYKKGDEIYIEGEIRNYNFKTDDRTMQTNYVLINTVKATFGQKSRRHAAAEKPDENIVSGSPDTGRGRRKRIVPGEMDDSE